jgi:hypothetical protein
MQRVGRRRSFIALVAAVLLVVTSGSAALATTTRYPIESNATAPAVVLDAGTMTQHGSVVLFLGVKNEQTQVSSSPYGAYVAGLERNVFSYVLDPTKGSGFWWGMGTHWPDAQEGGSWECFWAGAMRNWVWSGQGVCHGAGTLKGWQWRADLSMVDNVLFTQGYIFFPGDRSTPD